MCVNGQITDTLTGSKLLNDTIPYTVCVSEFDEFIHKRVKGAVGNYTNKMMLKKVSKCSILTK